MSVNAPTPVLEVKALGITGFCPAGGKTAHGKALHAKIMLILAAA